MYLWYTMQFPHPIQGENVLTSTVLHKEYDHHKLFLKTNI